MDSSGAGYLAQLIISAILGGAAGLFVRRVGGIIYMLLGIFALLMLIGMMSIDSANNAEAWNATGEASGGILSSIFGWFVNAFVIAPLISLGGSIGFYLGFRR